MNYRYSTEDIHSIVDGADGNYDDGLDAYVSVRPVEGASIIELTSTEEDKADRVTERFRVTVERIEGDQ
ncbi:hypothetical protein [Glycomyces tenuis]|uniref:hypothetical protein n=1 Tax=Glycomyces tenuis TaxID=58116 RepID=UPI00042464CD|nr:hypothetical protein [Glycomyces tenuis]